MSEFGFKCKSCGYELDHKRNFIITEQGAPICEKCYDTVVTTSFVENNGKIHKGNDVLWFSNSNFYENYLKSIYNDNLDIIKQFEIQIKEDSNNSDEIRKEIKKIKQENKKHEEDYFGLTGKKISLSV